MRQSSDTVTQWEYFLLLNHNYLNKEVLRYAILNLIFFMSVLHQKMLQDHVRNTQNTIFLRELALKTGHFDWQVTAEFWAVMQTFRPVSPECKKPVQVRLVESHLLSFFHLAFGDYYNHWYIMKNGAFFCITASFISCVWIVNRYYIMLSSAEWIPVCF